MHLRGQLKTVKAKSWPPQPDELHSGYIKLPASLETFLNILLCGETQDGTRKLKRIVQSIGQDCLYAVSGGTIIPAKHILLPWGVK